MLAAELRACATERPYGRGSPLVCADLIQSYASFRASDALTFPLGARRPQRPSFLLLSIRVAKSFSGSCLPLAPIACPSLCLHIGTCQLLRLRVAKDLVWLLNMVCHRV